MFKAIYMTVHVQGEVGRIGLLPYKTKVQNPHII